MIWTPDDFMALRDVSRSLARGDKERARILLTEHYGPKLGERIYRSSAFGNLAAHHSTRSQKAGQKESSKACTERELEILACAAKGLSDSETAELLLISVNTVKTHKRRLFQKLGAKNVAHAVAIGYETGLLGAKANE